MEGGLLPGAVAVLKADITDFESKMHKAIGQFDSVSSKKGNFEALANVGKAAFLGLSTAALGFGAIAVKQAAEQEEANARLTTSFADVGSKLTATSKPVEDLEGRLIKLGFADDQTADSLSKLSVATRDPAKAMKDEALAADVARGRHIDLAAATDILVKAETGHVAQLGRIGIRVKDANGQLLSQDQVLKNLASTYQGQAAAYTQTFAGKMQVLKVEAQQLEEKIGFLLIPKIEALGHAAITSADFLQHHTAIAKGLAVVVGGPLVLAMGAYIAQQVRSIALSGLQAASKLPQMFLALGAVIRGTTAADVVLNETMMATQGTMLLGVAGAAGLAAGLLGIGAVFRSNIKDANGFADSIAKGAGANPQAQLQALKNKLHDLTAELKGQTHLGAFWLSDSAAKKANEVDALKGKIKGLQASIDGQTASTAQASDAMDQYGQALDGTTSAAADAAKAVDSLKQDTVALISAQKAKRDADVGVQSATQAVADGQAKLSTLLRTNAVDSRAVAQASRDLTHANEAAADAQDRLTQAKKAFDTLVAGPSARDQTDAQMKVAQTTDDIERAQVRLRTSEKALLDLRKTGTASYSDLESAQLDVDDATRGVTQAGESQADAQQALNDLMAAGTPGSQQYTDAQHNLRDAQRGVDDANQQVADSQDKLATAQQGDLTLTQQIADAKNTLRNNEKQLADAKDSAGSASLALFDAQQKENDALAGGAQAALDLRTELQGIIDQSPGLANNPFFQSLQSVLQPVAQREDDKIRFGRPHRAGGPASAGELFRVNEDGDEYFRPNVGGTVIPLGGSGPSGGSVHVEVKVAGSLIGGSPADIANALVPYVVGALNTQARRGTNMSAALRTN